VVEKKLLTVMNKFIIIVSLVFYCIGHSCLAKKNIFGNDSNASELNELALLFFNGKYDNFLSPYPLPKKTTDREMLYKSMANYWNNKSVQGFVNDVSNAIKNESLYDLLILRYKILNKNYAKAVIDYYSVNTTESKFQNALVIYFFQGVSGKTFMTGDLDIDFKYTAELVSTIDKLSDAGLDNRGLKHLIDIDVKILSRMMKSFVMHKKIGKQIKKDR